MYMLDTNICIYIMKRRSDALQERLRRILPGEIRLSCVVLAELWYGVSKSTRREHNEAALSDFLSVVAVDDWPAQAAPIYGDVRAFLESEGRTIGGNDLLIASHALVRNAILVTSNTREFERVPDLAIEDWA